MPVAVRFNPAAMWLILAGTWLLYSPRLAAISSWGKHYWLFGLALVPLLPVLFVKFSLPPYFGDEFYHYLPPAGILYPAAAQKISDLYNFLPQSLDNIYRLTFVLTRSYVVARILHFAIVVSALLTVGEWLKNQWGNLIHRLWQLGSLYFALNLSSTATSGLVDAATAAVVLLAIIASISGSFLAAVAWWGIALGFKYSAIVPMLAWGLLTLPLVWQNRRGWPAAVMLFMITGGYWLARNLWLTGNPIYPLGNFPAFFSGWTVPIAFLSLPQVARELFLGSWQLAIPLLVSIPFLLLARYSHKRLIVTMLGVWLIEVITVKFLGGFLVRYYYHWIFLAGIILLLPLAFPSRFRFVYALILAAVFVPHLANTLNFIYTAEYLPRQQVRYAIGQVSINDWIDQSYPQMAAVIKLCGQPGPWRTLHLFDPDLMWFTTATQFKGFLVNCVPRAHDISQEGYATPSGLLASSHPCLPDSQLPSLIHDSEVGWELKNYPHALGQRQYNNYLVCKSRLVLPALYELSLTP